jgi:hypothetical protein
MKYVVYTGLKEHLVRKYGYAEKRYLDIGPTLYKILNLIISKILVQFMTTVHGFA